MTIDNFHFYFQNRLIQTGQTGGQLYSDTSPFSVPWRVLTKGKGEVLLLFTFPFLQPSLNVVKSEAKIRVKIFHSFQTHLSVFTAWVLMPDEKRPSYCKPFSLEGETKKLPWR